MISPTVGRIVWYTPNSFDRATMNFQGLQPLAATVAYVWNDRLVNLAVTDHNGFTHSRTSVPLLQDGDPRPDGAHCEWMPYQKGQAAKHEQLEKQSTSG